MTRFLCGCVALGMLSGAVGQAKRQARDRFTTSDGPGAQRTFSRGIDENQIVGFRFDPGHPFVQHAFELSSGQYNAIAVPGSPSPFAQGINHAQIVGMYTAGSQAHACLLRGGTYRARDGASAISMSASDINTSGSITGT
jgi:hypothetical protein